MHKYSDFSLEFVDCLHCINLLLLLLQSIPGCQCQV